MTEWIWVGAFDTVWRTFARPSFAEFDNSVTKYFSEITLSLCYYHFTTSLISEHSTILEMNQK